MLKPLRQGSACVLEEWTPAKDSMTKASVKVVTHSPGALMSTWTFKIWAGSVVSMGGVRYSLLPSSQIAFDESCLESRF